MRGFSICPFMRGLLLAMLLAAPLPGWAEPIVMATTASPPLSDAQQAGMLDLIVKEAFTRSGLEVNLVQLPSERGLSMADAGQVDGDVNRIGGLEKAYANLVQVPESNMRYEFMAFTMRKDVEIRNWSDLAEYTVGYVIGWKIYDEHVSSRSVIKVATPDNLFMLLASGRVDVALYYRLGGYYYAGKLGLTGLRALEPPLAQREMYMYVHRNHADIVPLLAGALRSMKGDGTYDAIVAPFTAN